MTAVILLLAAAGSQVLVVDEVIHVPASRMRLVHLSLQQRPAVVECAFEVEGEKRDVRVALMGREDGEAFRRGRAHKVLRATPYQESGRFRHPVDTPGEYFVAVDNRLEGRGEARVRLRVSLLFHEGLAGLPETLPARRKAAVIIVSLVLFFAVALWSGRKLLAANERRRSF